MMFHKVISSMKIKADKRNANMVVQNCLKSKIFLQVALSKF